MLGERTFDAKLRCSIPHFSSDVALKISSTLQTCKPNGQVASMAETLPREDDGEVCVAMAMAAPATLYRGA